MTLGRIQEAFSLRYLKWCDGYRVRRVQVLNHELDSVKSASCEPEDCDATSDNDPLFDYSPSMFFQHQSFPLLKPRNDYSDDC